MSQTPLKVGATGAFLLTEKNFRKTMGYQDLWTLAGIAFHGGNVCRPRELLQLAAVGLYGDGLAQSFQQPLERSPAFGVSRA